MKKCPTSFLKKIGLPLVVFLATFLLAKSSLAIEATDLGTAVVEDNLSLSASSPVTIIIRIIQVVFSLLGLILVITIMYGGFLWTTSGGSEDKIKKAKQVLKNAVIGVVIILSAWGISSYVLSLFTDKNSTALSLPASTANFKNLSLGTLGSCSIESVFPAPGTKDVARNSSILVTSKEAFQLDTVCINRNTKNACACDNTPNCNLLNPTNIQVYKTADGNSCVSAGCADNITNIEVSVPAGNKTLVLMPVGYLGSASGNVEYAVRLTNELKKAGGEALFKTCSSDFLEWTFETNDKLDLTPPQVLLGNIFPPIDNLADTFSVGSEAKAAKAQIVVSDCPKIKTAASIISVVKIGTSEKIELIINPNYSGTVTYFKLQIDNGKLKLFSGDNLLGASDIIDGVANFDGYFSVTLPAVVNQGNLWTVRIKPAAPAQTLTIGSDTYIFVGSKSGAGNEILVPAVCSSELMTANMKAALSSNYNINVFGNGNTLNLFSKQTGVSGNSLNISSTGNGLTITKFSGGTDKSDLYEIKGLKDKPMNSVVQVTFNEAVNPMVLSGSSDELKSYIRLVNASRTAKTNGEACSAASDCLSYNCEATVCVGDYVSGKFSLTNAYRTLEFISDKECGVNSCGEKMYCLPAGSNLALKINAAKLKTCSSVTDCSSLAPYSECVAGVCRDVAKGMNYPAANSLQLDGVVDLAFNSLDGNRDNQAEGPITAVYPYFIEGDNDLTKRDGFEFSFWVSNEINLIPPTISLTSPYLKEVGVRLTSPVIIDFNDLMMNSSLRTGSLEMKNDLTSVEHKLVNLRSLTDKPLGYWMESENKEQGTPDGEPDYTSIKILHSDFFEAVTYVSQIGSGVKNIYQNCFKPSIGPGCVNLSEENPSCCSGTGTNSLNSDGNCVN